MNVNTQDYLRLCEETHQLLFWDIETTGREGEYHSVLVVSLKPYGLRPKTFTVTRVGHDRKLVREAREELARYQVWCTYYGKGFDVPFLETALLHWGLPKLVRRPHVDLYYTLRSRLLTGRHSQAHYLEFLSEDRRKLPVSARVWRAASYEKASLSTLVKRCESDTEGLESLYKKTGHLIQDITR